MKIIIKTALISGCLLAGSPANAAELQFQFSSPSFSGNGYGSYLLTLKQLEDQQVEKNRAAAEAIRAAAEAAAANTPQAQFINNLQARIYSQLAKQITDSLFGAGDGLNCADSGGEVVCPSGLLNLGGNTIDWFLSSDNKNIIITVTDNNDPAQFTRMTIPVGSLGF